MQTSILRVCTVATLALALGAGAALAATATERIDQVFELSPGGSVELKNTNGSIEIESWDRDEVRVVAEKRIKARSDEDAEEALEHLRVEFEQTSDGLRIDTHYPRRSEGVLSWLFGDNVNMQVSYKLTLPRNIDLEAVTVNGGISVYETSGTMRLRSTNGSIKVSDAAGSVDAHTTNGAIKVELTELVAGEDLAFGTTNGSITVYLPKTVAASIKARTVNGSIQTDFPIQVSGSLSRRRLEGEINGGGDQIDLRTTNGSIKLLEL